MIANRYQCIGIIGKGEFGSLYKAVHTRTHQYVALKREPIDSPGKLLKNEAKIYQHLVNSVGFPRIKWFGIYDDSLWLAMDLLGPSLWKWKRGKKGSICKEEIDTIGIQMLSRLETLHEKGLIHRDIKPDNFLWSSDDSVLLLYLIDFGFAKPYCQQDGSHNPYRDKRTPLGTPMYISCNVQKGIEPSRRDDVESVVYVMITLFQDSYTDVPESYSPTTRCSVFRQESEERDPVLWKQGLLTDPTLPKEWCEMLAYVRNLGFFERPDYSYLRRFLH